MILYRQQLVENPKFSLIPSYGWTINGSTWVKNKGSISKTNTVAGTLYQSDILFIGVQYRLRFNMYGRTTGTLSITNKAGGTTHLSTTLNQVHIIDFVADGTDIIFNATSTWNGTISQVSLHQLPEYFELDLTEDIPVPMNFNIDDIFKVNQRKAAWSKSIVIPGTHNNNLAFNHIYKVNTDSLFNPSIKSRVILKNNGIPFFDGTLALDDYKKKIKDNIESIEYSVSVVGELVSIYDKLGDLTIKDLDFSEYNHVYGIERAYGSWFNDITINGATGQANTINTYTSPTVTALTNVVVDGYNRPEFTFASAHAFAVGDEIFYDAPVPLVGTGIFSFDQTVLQVTASNKIVLACTQKTPFSGSPAGTMSKRQLAGFGYWYPCVNYGTWMKNWYASGFLGGTGLLEIGQTYIIKTYNTGDDFTNVGAVSNTGGEIFTATGTTPTLWTGPTVLTTFRDISITNDKLQSKFGTDDTSVYGDTGSYWEIYDFVPHIFLWEVFAKMLELIDYEYICPFFDSKIFRRLIIPLEQTYANTGLTDGDNIVINDFLPGIKLKDVLNTILNMFNLVIKPDDEDKDTLEFINRGEFFDNAKVVWTKKLQSSEQLNIKLMNRDLPKIYNFKYKDGGDFYNIQYNSDFGDQSNDAGLVNIVDRKYGDYILEARSDFLSSENKIELIFETSVLSGYNVSPNLSTQFMSVGYSADANTGDNIKRSKLNKIHIAGMAYTNSMNFISLFNPGDNKMQCSFYPYAGHIDNFYQPIPTHDLGFGIPLAVYFNYSDPTSPINTDLSNPDWDTNCLYNKYWKRYIEAIVDYRSKTVEGTFKLNSKDIYNLDFQSPVQVGDLTMKLNKVKDWDSNGSGLCKCEFLTIN